MKERQHNKKEYAYYMDAELDRNKLNLEFQYFFSNQKYYNSSLDWKIINAHYFKNSSETEAENSEWNFSLP